jgi:hypothetical protein
VAGLLRLLSFVQSRTIKSAGAFVLNCNFRTPKRKWYMPPTDVSGLSC